MAKHTETRSKPDEHKIPEMLIDDVLYMLYLPVDKHVFFLESK